MSLESIGSLTLEKASFADFIESQSKRLTFGTEARTMNKILRSQGTVVPSFAFRDEHEPIAVRIRDVLSLKAELLRRNIVRSGYYRVYRCYYFLRHLRVALGYMTKALQRSVRK